MKTKRQKIGLKFEKEVYNFLKKNFDKVEWLSKKNDKSTYDFLIKINGKAKYVESKFISKGKPILRSSQKDADFVATNTKKGKINLIPNKHFSKFLQLFDNKHKRSIRKAEYGKGIVVKYGNRYFILLNPNWALYNKIQEEDEYDIENMLLLNKVKKKKRKNEKS